MKEQVNIWSYLEKRFPPAEFALLPEVRDMAGSYANRSADAIAFGLWPSRGLQVIGIENKASRSDWLRELKKPEKAENLFKYCDRWYLVTTDDEIAKKEEIPAAWGWLAVKGAKLVTMVEAPILTPQPLTRHFMAAVLKRACEGKINADTITERIKEAEERGAERAQNSQKYELNRIKENYESIQHSVRVFEEASGVHIRDNWQLKNIAAAVKFIVDGGMPRGRKDLEASLKRAEDLVKHLQSGISLLPQFETENSKIIDEP